MAVLVAVTGAFAFKPKVLPPGSTYGVTGTVISDVTNPDGTHTIKISTDAVDITGLVKGIDFFCDEPETLCYFVETSQTVVTHNADGSVTYTNVTIRTEDYSGKFRLAE